MIESIYSNENGDADRTNRVQTSFKMPKNIRQVGKSSTTKKIYVEDYVMTFIKQLVGSDYSGCKIAVLMGQSVKLDGCRNIFISGAVEVKNIDASNEIVFSNDTWTAIYEDIKKYFVDSEIVGWFIGGPGYLLEEEEKILKAHVDNFAGQDKTLLTYDNMEREEAFLNYENNRLCKLDGYYIYYEKNEEMQNYMIDNRQEESGSEASYDDRVSREIRTVLQNKKPPEEESKSVTRLMYAAGTLLAIIVLVVGAAMLGNYDQMNSIQSTLNHLAKNLEQVQANFANDENADAADKSSADSENVADASDAETTDASEDGLNVEVVPGDVKPIEESNQEGNTDKNDKNEDAASDEELAEQEKDNQPKEQKDTAKDDDKAGDKKEEVKYYTVKSGDTLADISYKLYKTYTKVDKIKELNNIEDSDLIYAGQKLIVP